MRFVSVQNGQLIDTPTSVVATSSGFRTPCETLNALAPGGSFAHATIHELLVPVDRPPPLVPALLMASSTATTASTNAESARRLLVVIDPDGSFFPPALRDWNLEMDRLLVVRPAHHDQAVHAAAEALRCPAVGYVVAPLGRLSRIEARRLQLSAETGGGVGILLRPDDHRAAEHAAVTRWRVVPVPGTRLSHRWMMQLVHGHGGHVGQAVLLEHSRETHLLRATAQLVDRPATTTSSARRHARAS